MLILKSPAFCLPPFQAANFFSLLSHWVSLTCHPYLECLPVRDPCSLCPSPPTYPTPSSLLSRFLSSLLHPLLPPSQILLSILVWRPGKPFQHPRCHCPCCWSQARGCTVPSCLQGKHFIAVPYAWRCAAYVCIALGMRRACWPQSMPGTSGPPSMYSPTQDCLFACYEALGIVGNM